MENLVGIAMAQSEVDTRDRLKKFMETDGYQEFIVDGFMNDEVVRVSQALIEDAMQDEVDQKLLKQKITAPAHLGQYFLTIKQIGNRAEMQIQESTQETIEAEIAENQKIEIDPITGDECIVEDN